MVVTFHLLFFLWEHLTSSAGFVHWPMTREVLPFIFFPHTDTLKGFDYVLDLPSLSRAFQYLEFGIFDLQTSFCLSILQFFALEKRSNYESYSWHFVGRFIHMDIPLATTSGTVIRLVLINTLSCRTWVKSQYTPIPFCIASLQL